MNLTGSFKVFDLDFDTKKCFKVITKKDRIYLIEAGKLMDKIIELKIEGDKVEKGNEVSIEGKVSSFCLQASDSTNKDKFFPKQDLCPVDNSYYQDESVYGGSMGGMLMF